MAWENDAAREPWMVGEPTLTSSSDVERQGESCVYVAKVDVEGAFGPVSTGDHVIFPSLILYPPRIEGQICWKFLDFISLVVG